MTYLYELNTKMSKKYNITHVEVSGWYGIDDKFNKYWNCKMPIYQQIVKTNFTEYELDEMLKKPKSYREF